MFIIPSKMIADYIDQLTSLTDSLDKYISSTIDELHVNNVRLETDCITSSRLYSILKNTESAALFYTKHKYVVFYRDVVEQLYDLGTNIEKYVDNDTEQEIRDGTKIILEMNKDKYDKTCFTYQLIMLNIDDLEMLKKILTHIKKQILFGTFYNNVITTKLFDTCVYLAKNKTYIDELLLKCVTFENEMKNYFEMYTNYIAYLKKIKSDTVEIVKKFTEMCTESENDMTPEKMLAITSRFERISGTFKSVNPSIHIKQKSVREKADVVYNVCADARQVYCDSGAHYIFFCKSFNDRMIDRKSVLSARYGTFENPKNMSEYDVRQPISKIFEVYDKSFNISMDPALPLIPGSKKRKREE